MSEVFFYTCVGGRLRTEYDRTQLHLGQIVYVELEKDGTPRHVYPQARSGATPYAVGWISPSEWAVFLEPQMRAPTRTVERVLALTPALSREEVEIAVGTAASDIRFTHQYKTREYRRSRLHTVEAVAERLDLVDRLRDELVSRKLFHHWEPLVTYLLLTCFDLLGQPADWLTFADWLRSTRTRAERDDAVADLNEGLDPVGVAEGLHKAYQSRFGVKTSFFRFLREVLSEQERRTLLDSVRLDVLANPPDLKARIVSDD